MACIWTGPSPKNIIWTEASNRKRDSPVPVHVTLYWPAALTKTNRENKNVKYNITDFIYIYFLNDLNALRKWMQISKDIHVLSMAMKEVNVENINITSFEN
jgi:hypothetical protein